MTACSSREPARLKVVLPNKQAQQVAHALRVLVTCKDGSVPTGAEVALEAEATEVALEVPACGKALAEVWLLRDAQLKDGEAQEGDAQRKPELTAYYGAQAVELVSQQETQAVITANKRGNLSVLPVLDDKVACELAIDDTTGATIAALPLTPDGAVRLILPPGTYRAECVGRSDVEPLDVEVVFATHSEYRLTKRTVPIPPDPPEVIAPSELTYANNNLTLVKGVAMLPLIPTALGSPIESFTMGLGSASESSLAQATGLVFNTTTGEISGTPDRLSVESSYTVTAFNSAGSDATSVTIAVVDLPPSNLVYSSPSITYQSGQSIAPNLPSSEGGPVVSYEISVGAPSGQTLGALTGLQFNPLTGAITGVAIECPRNTFTITATNSGGSTSTTVDIAATPLAPLALFYSQPVVTYGFNADISPNSPSSSGGAPTSYSIGLGDPSGQTLFADTGLIFDPVTGIISGTATAMSGPNQYLITATNSGGSANTSVTIAVAVPMRDCVEILAQTPVAASGIYLIDPDGPAGESPFEVYCDMTTDGGGWAKVQQFAGSPMPPSANSIGSIVDHPTSTFAKLSDDQVNAFGTMKEYRFSASAVLGRLFLRSDSVFDSNLPGYGIHAAAGLRANGTMPAAWNPSVMGSPHVLDSLHVIPAVTGDNCDRIYTDPSGVIECAGAPGQRCFRTGGAPCNGEVLDDLAIWVRRGNAIGEEDPTFASGALTLDPGNEYNTIVSVDSADRVYVGIETNLTNSVQVCRYDDLGVVDSGFAGTGCASASGARGLSALRVDASDRPVFGGIISGQIMSLTRLTSSGGADFDITDNNPCNAGVNQPDSFNGLAFTADNKIVLGGSSQGSLGSNESAVWRYLDNGTKDTSFNGSGFVCVNFNGPSFLNAGAQDAVRAVSVDSLGRIIALSNPDNAFGIINLLSRYTDTGYDTTFNGGGFNTYFGPAAGHSQPAALLTDKADRHYTYTTNQTAGGIDLVVRRYTIDGIVDGTYGVSGIARFTAGVNLTTGGSQSMVFDQNNNLLVVASNGNNALVVRFAPTGLLDQTFGTGGVVTLTGITDGRSIAIDSEGRIYVGGMKFNTNNDSVVVRLN